MSHNWCPPSRRGHTWRETASDDERVLRAGLDPRAARVCQRCGQLGCVNKQGLISLVERA